MTTNVPATKHSLRRERDPVLGRAVTFFARGLEPSIRLFHGRWCGQGSKPSYVWAIPFDVNGKAVARNFHLSVEASAIHVSKMQRQSMQPTGNTCPLLRAIAWICVFSRFSHTAQSEQGAIQAAFVDRVDSDLVAPTSMAACEVAIAVKADAERNGKQIRELLSAVTALDTAAQAIEAALPERREEQVEISDCKLALTSAAYDLLDAHTNRVDAVVDALTAELAARKAASKALALSSAAAGTPRRTKYSSGGKSASKRSRNGSSPSSPLPEQLDVGVDPAEPTYCLCGQVAFGEMLMCTNPFCTTEWFHLPCVDIHPGNKPQGDWVCPLCESVAREQAAAERARAAAMAAAAATATPGGGGSSFAAAASAAAAAASSSTPQQRELRKTPKHRSRKRRN